MSYTVKNLREVRDSAPDFGFTETQEARFAQEDLNAERTGFSHHLVRAGKRQGFGHRHDEAEEVYVVLAGSGRVKLDDDVVDIGPRDAIRVAPHVARSFEADAGEDLEVLAFGVHHPGDGEILPGFWTD